MPIYTFKLVAFLTVLTSESTGVGGFSLHVMFAISCHWICDLTEAM